MDLLTRIVYPLKWCRAALFPLFLLLPLLPASGTSALESRQYKVEAAFLYNFLNYITWPGKEGPADLKEAVICVEEGEPVGRYLEYVQRKMISERHLTIRLLTSVDNSAGCHILFLRNVPSSSMNDLLAKAASQEMLLISTGESFIAEGGMISLTQEGTRTRIGIYHTLLQQRGFQVSSRLLELAAEVK